MKLITLGTAAGNGRRGQGNASNLVICGGKYYLFDAGEPVYALLRSRDIPTPKVENVFISHLHCDHFGGAVSLLKDFAKYQADFPGSRQSWYLPVMLGRDALLLYMKSCHRPLPDEKYLKFTQITEGVFFDDGNLKVTAFPNEHMGKGIPSWSFLAEGEGKRLLITGDMRADFRDFPAAALAEPAWVLCESAHCEMENMLEKLKCYPIRHLIFSHGSILWHTDPERRCRFNRLSARMPFACEMAKDDQEFEITI